MNYRHAFHAGNFADVLKHAVIAQCLEHLQAKPKPFRVIDTHAGVGGYDLTSDEARRNPEWEGGIARVLAAKRPADVEDALAPYLSVVRAMNEGETLTAYPGSPELAARLMRADDRAHLCELHEADARTLDARYARDARIKVERRDGYKALSALVPPREKRGLVLVDPPFERFDVGLAEWLFETGLAAPEKILRADLWVRDLESEGKLAGAGVVIINPPYTLEAQLLALLPWLTETLQVGEGAGWRLDGAVTEDSLAVDEF